MNKIRQWFREVYGTELILWILCVWGAIIITTLLIINLGV
jgi:hypothetical protein